MKLYLPVVGTETLMEGYSEEVLGVFDTYDKAFSCLSNHYGFEKATSVLYFWRHVFDGEMTIDYMVKETDLNEELT